MDIEACLADAAKGSNVPLPLPVGGAQFKGWEVKKPLEGSAKAHENLPAFAQVACA